MPPHTDDLRIRTIEPLTPPAQLLAMLPCDDEASDTVSASRAALHQILHGRDDRLAVVVGPCSIHDPKAAIEYAQRLKRCATRWLASWKSSCACTSRSRAPRWAGRA